ncbi:MAG: AlbA family DNA-binding domain-containing protein [Nitrosotalea sp.]
MVHIPEDVEQWDFGLLANLVHEGYDENETLEFKSVLNESTHRIPKTACAFANTKGGFLVFGINNDRTKELTFEQRLMGLDDSDQLKRNIIDQIQNIKPSIPIDNLIFKKSNIKLPNNKVSVILKILKTTVGPHQYDHIFYKRISNGNEPRVLMK